MSLTARQCTRVSRVLVLLICCSGPGPMSAEITGTTYFEYVALSVGITSSGTTNLSVDVLALSTKSRRRTNYTAQDMNHLFFRRRTAVRSIDSEKGVKSSGTISNSPEGREESWKHR
ncbi:uncharacterized protein EDB91DRAFT_1141159 [Suillus paluster]|uniref:uncharacterized protein n=1 Tax=Suillus paluster TaxID=48578 RepID=UPI001B87CD09|nr:uncharacterized protein EDB91DRAFT_1141159 [Suillus paluster]KAG1737126.1 hypothetical protein EDB91DRAFT_1141159 [Suillus paluster]